jgi:hypothetical protein
MNFTPFLWLYNIKKTILYFCSINSNPNRNETLLVVYDNVGGIQPILIRLGYLVEIPIVILFLRNYHQNFWFAHRPLPVGLFFGQGHVPTYEFYGLSFSRALLHMMCLSFS